jgi:hypothetical protein
MIIYVDIDGVLCNVTLGHYDRALPDKKNIKIVNSLHDAGHTIVLWTARGKTTGIDWKELTKTQMEEWGVKYDELNFDKPHYDIFIEDKSINFLHAGNKELQDLIEYASKLIL